MIRQVGGKLEDKPSNTHKERERQSRQTDTQGKGKHWELGGRQPYHNNIIINRIETSNLHKKGFVSISAINTQNPPSTPNTAYDLCLYCFLYLKKKKVVNNPGSN